MRAFIPVRRIMVVAPNPAPTGRLDTILYVLKDFRIEHWNMLKSEPMFFAREVLFMRDDLIAAGATVPSMTWHCHEFDIEVETDLCPN